MEVMSTNFWNVKITLKKVASNLLFRKSGCDDGR